MQQKEESRCRTIRHDGEIKYKQDTMPDVGWVSGQLTDRNLGYCVALPNCHKCQMNTVCSDGSDVSPVSTYDRPKDCDFMKRP